jgi:hypothetical protein
MIVLLVNFLIFTALGCEFSPKVKKIYSFSGPVTLALKELGLLNKPQLKGISLFHPIHSQDFSGQRFAGGVFLSPSSLAELNEGIVLFDESRELRRIFQHYPGIQSHEVSTRTLTPLEVEKAVQKLLQPWLMNCSNAQIEKTQLELVKLKSLIPADQTFIFFLGEIKGDRLPEMLMVNDGVVKWMLSEKLIRSYPSELAYVSWSAKNLQSMSQKVFRIGITDSAGTMKKSFKQNGKNINLTFPGALVPGKGQLDAMVYLFENLAR